MTDVPVQISAWVAFLFWAAGELALAGVNLPTTTRSASWCRQLWLWGVTALSVHAVLAFGRVHAWSHAAAVEATARQVKVQMGMGMNGNWGVVINELLVAWWWADVALAWIRPGGWNRPGFARTLRRAVFWFLWFNGAVIFADGERRIVTAGACVGVLMAWWRNRPLPTQDSGSRERRGSKS